MRDGKLNILPIILAVAFILLALAAESIYMGDFEYRYRTRKFNRILLEKEKIMEGCLNGMEPILASGEKHGAESENRLFSLADENKITLLEYFEGKLIYWSDTDFDVPRSLNDSVYSKPFIFLQNGWFLTKSVKAGNEIIVGLLRVRSNYGFENDIINNGFVKDFGVPVETGFSLDRKASDFHITDRSGDYLFSLLFPTVKKKTLFIFVPLLLWTIALIQIIVVTFYILKYFKSRNQKATGLIFFFSAFAIIYLLILIAKIPGVIYQTELFSPYRYTMNSFIPSLGHLMLLSIFLSLLSMVFYFELKAGEKLTTRWIRFPLFTLLLIPGGIIFTLYHFVFTHLIFNSSINFETYKVLDLNLSSLMGFISLVLLFSLPFLYLSRLFRSIKMPSGITVIFSALIASFVYIPFFYDDLPVLISGMLFFILCVCLLWIFGAKSSGTFNKSVVASLLLALYFLFLITYLSDRKNEEKVKIQLVTYSTENDPAAENILLDIWPKISGDQVLRTMMNVPVFKEKDHENITGYLHNKYFTGYLGNYNLNIVLCRRADTLRLADPKQGFEDCFSFFQQKIQTKGHKLTGTEFYFIDNDQGRASYLGNLYFSFGNSVINGLFIDLYSDINVFQPGYSELLLDKNYHGYARLKDYSFAKYINGEIIISSGEFPYNKSDAAYVDKGSDYKSFNDDSYDHASYRNGNVTVVMSRPELTWQDIVISFAYLFAFIFVFSGVVMFLARRPVPKVKNGLNFRQKMQLSFIGILLFSFILIGYLVTTLTKEQYQTRHYENLRERLNSVYIELENKIYNEKVINPDIGSDNAGLDELLVRLSNIFNTDINIFDLRGYLVATSRPEIFYRNLISQRINNMAFINLVSLKKSEYVQKEKIGKMEYLSAYIPFYDADNELIAYVNLPYFRMQTALTRQISNMIVAIVNFTLLLIVVAMGLAVFISGRLTAPIAVLSSRLASVELGKKSEHLSYKGNDEVGELVHQYNRMVDELDDSARKLARSEREYAWREMAKQIAHEIKNPLTPMKLNVQQLYKSWLDSVPGFDKKIERFTKSQIEYIDNLSSIATAFSSFAKIPEANPVKVDLIEQIKTTLELFKSSDNIAFRFGFPHTEKIFIYADKEQVNGIFSNLIKNGIQSIQQGNPGIIRVNIETIDQKVVVSVSDNGTGIPEQLKSKMFIPNFTTKSSGTGLGLSIVKRYVESAGGRIWFDSEQDKGSTFFVEFPLMHTGL